MENKIFNWKDVEISILGQTYKPKPIEFVNEINSTKFEANITIIEDTHDILIKELKIRKISNFQKKKFWKKYYKIFSGEL